VSPEKVPDKVKREMEASLEKLLAGLEQAGWKNDRVNSNIPTLAISLALVNLCSLATVEQST